MSEQAESVLNLLQAQKLIKAWAMNGFIYEVNLGSGYAGGPVQIKQIESASGVMQWAKETFDIQLDKIPLKLSGSVSSDPSKKKPKKDLLSPATVLGAENSGNPSESA